MQAKQLSQLVLKHTTNGRTYVIKDYIETSKGITVTLIDNTIMHVAGMDHKIGFLWIK